MARKAASERVFQGEKKEKVSSAETCEATFVGGANLGKRSPAPCSGLRRKESSQAGGKERRKAEKNLLSQQKGKRRGFAWSRIQGGKFGRARKNFGRDKGGEREGKNPGKDTQTDKKRID